MFFYQQLVANLSASSFWGYNGGECFKNGEDFGELCERHNAVVSVDSTGGMINFENTLFDGKIQHTTMTLQFWESGVTVDKLALTDYRDFSTIRITERASSWNTAAAVHSWFADWRADVKAATRDVLKREIDPVIGMIKVDCALQHPTGMILALRKDGMVDSSATYHNIALVLLLQHEGRTHSPFLKEDISKERVKASSERVMKRLKKLAPFAIKQCNVHFYLAFSEGFKNMKNKPVTLRPYYPQMNDAFRNLAFDLYDEDLLARLIVRLAILIAIAETERIPCGDTSLQDEVRDHHDPEVVQKMRSDMQQLVDDAVNTVLGTTTEDSFVNAFIESDLATVGKKSQQKFKGHKFSRSIIDFVKGSLKFSATYPHNIDEKEKVIYFKTAIMYAPFSKDKHTRCLKDIPRLTGGFVSIQKAPFCGKTIQNPWFSSELASYWIWHLNRVAFISGSITKTAGIAWGLALFASNMSIEGHFNLDKNLTSTHEEAISDIPKFFEKRWEDCVKNGKFLTKQIRTSGAKRLRRENQKGAKESGASQNHSEESAVGSKNNDVEVAAVRDDDLESTWLSRKAAKKARRTEVVEDEYMNKLKKALEAAESAEKHSVHANDFKYDWGNKLSVLRAMKHVAKKSIGDS